MFGKMKKFKKTSKKVKKGVDNLLELCYYVQARLRAPNLENDTETRNANDSQ